MKKAARWISKRISAPTRTVRVALRAGRNGTGQELGAYSYWPDSARSCEASDDIAMRIEEDAEASGYKIVRE